MTWDAVPLTPGQRHLADALLRGEVVSMPRQNGRRAIAEYVNTAIQPVIGQPTSPPPAGPVMPVNNDLVFGGSACSNGCCRSFRSRSFPAPPWVEGSVYVRPMFQVIDDRPTVALDDEDGMRIDVDEYDRADRIFL